MKQWGANPEVVVETVRSAITAQFLCKSWLDRHNSARGEYAGRGGGPGNGQEVPDRLEGGRVVGEVSGPCISRIRKSPARVIPQPGRMFIPERLPGFCQECMRNQAGT